MTEAAEYLLIASHTAPKASRHGEGTITFNVLRDTSGTEVYLMLAANDRAGYFSKEPVPLSRIQKCLESIEPNQPIFAVLLKSAFVSGRSANNPGFLASCLRHLGLLQGMSGAPHRNVLAGDWSAWLTDMLTAPAEPFIAPNAESAITMNPPEHITRDDATTSPEAQGKKGRKHQAGRRELPSGSEEHDASPA